MATDLNNILSQFIANTYLLIETLNKKKIIIQNINGTNRDDTHYVIERDKDQQCVLSYDRVIKNGNIKTSSNAFRCPTLKEFDDFLEANKNNIKSINNNNGNCQCLPFKFSASDNYIKSFIDTDVFNSNYEINYDFYKVLTELNYSYNSYFDNRRQNYLSKITFNILDATKFQIKLIHDISYGIGVSKCTITGIHKKNLYNLYGLISIKHEYKKIESSIGNVKYEPKQY